MTVLAELARECLNHFLVRYQGLDDLYTRIINERFRKGSSTNLAILLILGQIASVKEPGSLRV
jgi:hypothetical protein